MRFTKREELTFAIPRSLNREWVSDTAWTLSMYLEAVAMLPQIYMFQRQAGDNAGTVEVHHVIRISLSDSAASPFDILVSGLCLIGSYWPHDLRTGLLPSLRVDLLARLIQGARRPRWQPLAGIYRPDFAARTSYHHGRFLLLLL